MHEPVLVQEVLQYLTPQDGEVYLDCTVGLGGHSAAIRAKAPGCTTLGLDRDPAALELAQKRLGDEGLVHGELGDLRAILDGRKVHGLLADLGVSSMQLDTGDRGFSFTKDGPLDMRMDTTRGPTARELIKHSTLEELGAILRDFGEERHAFKIARAIKEADLHTTLDLARICERAIPLVEQRKSKIHPATRTFQALRIAVNGELDQLARFLDAFPDVLHPGGRCVVISFHSLEDRLVKNRFRDLEWTSSLPRQYAERAGERPDPVCEQLTGKPVEATEAETERNPRSRSAKLRACVRTSFPNVATGAAR